MGAEEEDRGDALVVERFLRISRYITPIARKGVGIIGQPEPHYIFHRPLNLILRPFLNVGWILDALEEPTFPVAEAEGRFFSWAHFSEFPPVLAMRLRHDSGTLETEMLVL